MNLWLMRHSDPVPGVPMDSSRPLSDVGKQQAADMATFLVREIGRVDYVVTSPFVRATQTAEIMGKALSAPVIAETTALQPDGKPSDAWDEIKRLAQDSPDVLVVSHDPLINELLFWLIGLEGTNAQIRFEWGGIAHLKGHHQKMRLHWIVTPRLVQRDEEESVIEAARALVESLA